MDLEIQSSALQRLFSLKNLGKINVVLGKNGSGKSSLLRAFNSSRQSQPLVKYVPPERGGYLVRDGNYETNLQNPHWLYAAKDQGNRFDQYRQGAVSEFRTLETLVLREIEQDTVKRLDVGYKFDSVVEKLNTLLDHVELTRSPDGGFAVRSKIVKQDLRPETLSSGEVELISLGIEILSFAFASSDERFKFGDNWLLLDEPDSHIHPDLQHKLMSLLAVAVEEKPFNVLITTHSTAILSSLAEVASDVKVAFMRGDVGKLQFQSVDLSLKAVLPIFGAHPLSNVFNRSPVLLVEGESDERLWQQAVRSSGGGIKIWPCAAGDIQSLHDYEQKAASILGAVYDNAKAYSLRDRDDAPYEIADDGPIIRSRLNCRNAENLIVTDEVLALTGVDWATLQTRMLKWIDQNPDHPQYATVCGWRDANWDRISFDLKQLRNLILAQAGTSKPWEVLVGRAIAGLKSKTSTGEHGIANYLGPKLIAALKLVPG